ncbi:hypothetical protein [Alkalimarinus coralli]|uniref:hypothetical protein n=1 Tax=Alkalimarinus coralli TaxID=2935863 RepID=UPI00202B640E|nr:hypothetical protein [Alkalimarinus coralli]
MNILNEDEQTQSAIEIKPKGKMQKVALYAAYISYILAAISGIFLYIKTQELGGTDPITASFLASFFFFIFTGFSLMIMAKANLPSLKFDQPEHKKPK